MKISENKTINMSFSASTVSDDIKDGKCAHPKDCMYAIAIDRALRREWEAFVKKAKKNFPPSYSQHRVRIDSNGLKFNFNGYRWAMSPTPRRMKRNLIMFDADKNRGRACRVQPHAFTITAKRTSKIIPMVEGRQEQINEARKNRIREGREKKAQYTLKSRVLGMSSTL